MKKFEYIIPVEYEAAREALRGRATFIKRSQVEDVYFAGPGKEIVRLRRQDTVSKLSCTRHLDLDGVEENHESIVLDFAACREMLLMLGFRETDRMRLTRDAWKMHHYAISLDRIDGMGPFLVLECESKGENERKLKRSALKFVKSLGIDEAVDSPAPIPYTEPVAA